MPRIPYLDEKNIHVSSDLLVSIKNRRPGGHLLNLDKIILYSEPLTIGWQTMFAKLRQELTFSGKLRELIILRIAVLNHANYEFVQHAPQAIKEGVSQAQIDAITTWQNSMVFDEQEQAVLEYTDAMTKLVQVPDAVYKKLSEKFDKKQIVEITALVAGYNMVSRFLEALQITVDGE